MDAEREEELKRAQMSPEERLRARVEEYRQVRPQIRHMHGHGG